MQLQAENQGRLAPEASLENKLKSILNNASGEVTIELSKISVIHVVVRDGLLGMVPEIEGFHTDLCPEVFSQGRSLEQRQIRIPNRGSVETIAGQTPIPNNGARRVRREHS